MMKNSRYASGVTASVRHAANRVCKLLIVLAVTSLIVCVASPAGMADNVAPSLVNGLVVTGHSELKLKPDVAYLTIWTSTQNYNTKSVAESESAGKLSLLITSLKDAGVSPGDIETVDSWVLLLPKIFAADTKNGVGSNNSTSPPGSAPAGENYEAGHSVRVTVRRLSILTSIRDITSKQDLTTIVDLRYDIADHAKYIYQAVHSAVADAETNADALATANGVSCGQLMSSTEPTSPTITPIDMDEDRAKVELAQLALPSHEYNVLVTADVSSVYAFSSR